VVGPRPGVVLPLIVSDVSWVSHDLGWRQAPLAAANGPETLRAAGGMPSRTHTQMNSPLGRRPRPAWCPEPREDLARGSYASLRGTSWVAARVPAERDARTWLGTCWRAWPARRRSTVVQRWRAWREELAKGVDPRRRGTTLEPLHCGSGRLEAPAPRERPATCRAPSAGRARRATSPSTGA
jgi:hypothetical protein